jgi:hypothetical protein
MRNILLILDFSKGFGGKTDTDKNAQDKPTTEFSQKETLPKSSPETGQFYIEIFLISY